MKRLVAIFILIPILLSATAIAEINLGMMEELVLPMRSFHAVYAMDDGGFFLAGIAANGSIHDNTLFVRIDRERNEIWRANNPLNARGAWVISAALLSNGNIALLQQTDTSRYTLHVVHNGGILYSEDLAFGDEQVWPELFNAGTGFFLYYGERRYRDKLGGTFHEPAIEYRTPDGSVVWKHIFEDYEARIMGALPVEGGHILYGTTEEQKTGERYGESFLAKVDHTGVIRWVKTERGKNDRWRNYAGEGILREDGSFVLAGSITHLAKDGYPSAGLLAEFDGEGNKMWEETYKPSDKEFYDILGTAPIEDGYIILAEEVGYRMPSDIIRVDRQGKILETTQIEWNQN